MNYKLHNKATDLMQMYQDMEERIENLNFNAINNIMYMFPNIQAKHLNRIDTCKRGLERIEQAYIKVLTEILAV
jgi:hypothetical protein